MLDDVLYVIYFMKSKNIFICIINVFSFKSYFFYCNKKKEFKVIDIVNCKIFIYGKIV